MSDSDTDADTSAGRGAGVGMAERPVSESDAAQPSSRGRGDDARSHADSPAYAAESDVEYDSDGNVIEHAHAGKLHRRSKKLTKNQLLEIRKETNRLLRERQIAVPVKRSSLTLDSFLKSRGIDRAASKLRMLAKSGTQSKGKGDSDDSDSMEVVILPAKKSPIKPLTRKELNKQMMMIAEEQIRKRREDELEERRLAAERRRLLKEALRSARAAKAAESQQNSTAGDGAKSTATTGPTDAEGADNADDKKTTPAISDSISEAASAIARAMDAAAAADAADRMFAIPDSQDTADSISVRLKSIRQKDSMETLLRNHAAVDAVGRELGLWSDDEKGGNDDREVGSRQGGATASDSDNGDSLGDDDGDSPAFSANKIKGTPRRLSLEQPTMLGLPDAMSDEDDDLAVSAESSSGNAKENAADAAQGLKSENLSDKATPSVERTQAAEATPAQTQMALPPHEHRQPFAATQQPLTGISDVLPYLSGSFPSASHSSAARSSATGRSKAASTPTDVKSGEQTNQGVFAVPAPQEPRPPATGASNGLGAQVMRPGAPGVAGLGNDDDLLALLSGKFDTPGSPVQNDVKLAEILSRSDEQLMEFAAKQRRLRRQAVIDDDGDEDGGGGEGEGGADDDGDSDDADDEEPTDDDEDSAESAEDDSQSAGQSSGDGGAENDRARAPEGVDMQPQGGILPEAAAGAVKMIPKKKSLFVEEEAEVEEDEFMHMGGADGEDAGIDQYDLSMLADSDIEDIQMEAIMNLHMKQMLDKDKTEFEALLRDVTSGNLRKRAKRNDPSGKGYDIEDSDEENEAILRRIREQFKPKRTGKDGVDDEDDDIVRSLDKLASNPRTSAFAKSLSAGMTDEGGLLSSESDDGGESSGTMLAKVAADGDGEASLDLDRMRIQRKLGIVRTGSVSSFKSDGNAQDGDGNSQSSLPSAVPPLQAGRSRRGLLSRAEARRKMEAEEANDVDDGARSRQEDSDIEVVVADETTVAVAAGSFGGSGLLGELGASASFAQMLVRKKRSLVAIQEAMQAAAHAERDGISHLVGTVALADADSPQSPHRSDEVLNAVDIDAFNLVLAVAFRGAGLEDYDHNQSHQSETRRFLDVFRANTLANEVLGRLSSVPRHIAIRIAVARCMFCLDKALQAFSQNTLPDRSAEKYAHHTRVLAYLHEAFDLLSSNIFASNERDSPSFAPLLACIQARIAGVKLDRGRSVVVDGATQYRHYDLKGARTAIRQLFTVGYQLLQGSTASQREDIKHAFELIGTKMDSLCQKDMDIMFFPDGYIFRLLRSFTRHVVSDFSAEMLPEHYEGPLRHRGSRIPVPNSPVESLERILNLPSPNQDADNTEEGDGLASAWSQQSQNANGINDHLSAVRRARSQFNQQVRDPLQRIAPEAEHEAAYALDNPQPSARPHSAMYAPNNNVTVQVPRPQSSARSHDFSSRVDGSSNIYLSELDSIEEALGNLRRPRLPWSLAETDALEEGIRLFGFAWVKILKHFTILSDRTQVDLKDRARVMRRKYERLGEDPGIWNQLRARPRR
ncbi:hypothetical protein HK105_203606 [Polyrhizophydium stewartii]|uniref:Myb-like domain-containing protein n=1 Tax=Polyrhizophydium stewartii TaxID=2732419 RepID=A0ABR4NBB9_9FUNG